MGWLIALLVLFLLAILPLGVSVIYNADGPLIRIVAGIFKIKVFPGKKQDPDKPPKAKKKKEQKPKEKSENKNEKKTKKNIAMTGEITLTGKVLPIGGLREKLVAASRSSIKLVFLPKENKNDLDEIPENIKKNIKFILVDDYKQIYEKVW